MPWTLEIHHLDIKIAGDSTLIVAKNGTNVYSVLIDAGRLESGEAVHNYIVNTAAVTQLGAMVATHYDGDHLGGLVTLLTKTDNVYGQVRVYDRGWPAGGPQGGYQAYLTAINQGPNRNRITKPGYDVSPGDVLVQIVAGEKS